MKTVKNEYLELGLVETQTVSVLGNKGTSVDGTIEAMESEYKECLYDVNHSAVAEYLKGVVKTLIDRGIIYIDDVGKVQTDYFFRIDYSLEDDNSRIELRINRTTAISKAELQFVLTKEEYSDFLSFVKAVNRKFGIFNKSFDSLMVTFSIED